MLLPIYGFVQGDVLGVLVLVQDHETVADLAAKLASAAAVRVKKVEAVDVYFKQERLEPTAKLSRVGISALDRVDLVPRST